MNRQEYATVTSGVRFVPAVGPTAEKFKKSWRPWSAADSSIYNTKKKPPPKRRPFSASQCKTQHKAIIFEKPPKVRPPKQTQQAFEIPQKEE